jgi:hypothetical protein
MTDDELIVYLLRSHRHEKEACLDHYATSPPRPAWSHGLDAQVRLELAQVNAAIAKILRHRGTAPGEACRLAMAQYVTQT